MTTVLARPHIDWQVFNAGVTLRIRALERETLVLMRHGAVIKAQGPSHTANYLRAMLSQMIGPNWERIADEWLECRE